MNSETTQTLQESSGRWVSTNQYTDASVTPTNTRMGRGETKLRDDTDAMHGRELKPPEIGSAVPYL